MQKINKLIESIILLCEALGSPNFIKKTEHQLILSPGKNSTAINIGVFILYFFIPLIFILFLFIAQPLLHVGTIFILFLILLWPYQYYLIAKANNRVVIDFEQQEIVMTNLDFFCKRFIKKKRIKFQDIQHLIKKKMKFSKTGNPFRLLLELESEKIVLIDVGSEDVAEKLFDVISLMLKQK